jgi:hypothetical protein
MKTLVGSLPPDEPEDDDGPVYVVTTLGSLPWVTMTSGQTITITETVTLSAD